MQVACEVELLLRHGGSKQRGFHRSCLSEHALATTSSFAIGVWYLELEGAEGPNLAEALVADAMYCGNQSSGGLLNILATAQQARRTIWDTRIPQDHGRQALPTWLS